MKKITEQLTLDTEFLSASLLPIGLLIGLLSAIII